MSRMRALLPSSSVLTRRVVHVGLRTAFALFLFGLCLFADCTALKSSSIFTGALQGIAATLLDPGIQWMVFLCGGIYLVGFVILRWRLAGAGEGGTPWNACLPSELWLGGLVVLVALAYGLDYGLAVTPAQALTLLGGVVLGQAAGLWAGRRRIGNSQWQMANAAGEIVPVLITLLMAAALWQQTAGHLFQYREQTRWSGPWDNPNTFGVLMGMGAVLALGRLIQRKAETLKTEMLKGEQRAESGKQKAETEERKAETLKPEASGPRTWAGWLGRSFLLGSATMMGVGLVKSYSRGAWVGAAAGLTYLAWQYRKAESGKQKAEMGNKFAVAVIVASVCVIGFWSFRNTERLIARRAYTVANVNDFSWRNRVAAYEGALQMMAERPWFGFGWNQPEGVYEHYYRAAKVSEGMAIQLNDFLMLGMTLGIPALWCFVVYVGLCLSPMSKVQGPRSKNPSPECRQATLDVGRWTLDLPAVCRAGALVLLVGFWFDGGLFKLATGATFWILLELGRHA